jgi:hypothetical protein
VALRLPLRHTAIAFAALAGLIAPATAPANAAAPREPAAAAATSLTLAPVPVSYPGLQATITGTLEVQGTGQPIPGQVISVRFSGCPGPGVSIGTATTGTDGSFTLTTTLPGAGYIYATFAGDTTHAAVTTEIPTTNADMPTRVTLDPLPNPVTAFSMIQVTGSVQVQQPDGTWIPAVCAPVTIHGHTYPTSIFTETRADGTYTAYLSVDDTGPFQASVGGPSQYAFTEPAQSATQSPAVNPAATQVAGFAPAATPEIAQDGLSFTAQGLVQSTAFGGTTWTLASPSLPAQLWFQPQGSATWTLMAAGPLFGNPPFAGIPGYLPDGQPAEGSWQIRTLPTDVFQATQSPIITVPVKVRTWINGAAITTGRRHHHFTGTLDDQPAAGPLAGQQIRLYYRLPGTRRWHYLTTTSTNTAGRFSFPLTTAGRWYRAAYPGHGYYLPATSTALFYRR